MQDKHSNINPHITLIVFCVTCVLVYLHLYTVVAYQTKAVTNLMNHALGHFEGVLQDFRNGFRKRAILKEERFEQKYGEWTRRKNTIINDTNVLLVIFTTFSENKEKHTCRNNTIKNLQSFGSFVRPVLITEDFQLSARVKKRGWDVYPPSKTAVGVPILKNMFIDIKKRYRSKFYAYVNGDILFTQGLVRTLYAILNSTNVNQTHPMLIIGQRTNVKFVTKQEASTFVSIEKAAERGFLFTPWAEDYFITNSFYPWHECPEIIIGRKAYDNWLVLDANERNYTTIDATKTIVAVHQTTSAGNRESHAKKDKSYNINLLNKLNRNVQFESGLTTCAKTYTDINLTTNQIQILMRSGC